MPELTIFELFAWPALVAGFGWLSRGPRAIAPVYAGAFALAVLALWFGSSEGGANRAMLARLGEVALWTAGLSVPVGLYTWVIVKARRKAAERTDI
jgi:hypothetical protein